MHSPAGTSTDGMNIAIVGYSRFVQKKVIEEIVHLFPGSHIHIFSRRKLSTNLNQDPQIKFFNFSQYEAMLTTTNYLFAYISSENSLHFTLAAQALRAKNNVIVDKPIAISLDHVLELCSLAEKAGVALSESLIWLHHKQLKLLDQFQKSSLAFKASSFFTIPLFENENFRTSNMPGSGVFWDMSVYGSSLMHYLGMHQVESIKAYGELGSNAAQHITIQSSAPYRKLSITLAFGYRYRNNLKILSDNSSISFGRIFTSDKTVGVPVAFQADGRTISGQVCDNAMQNYLLHFLDLCDNKALAHFELNLIRQRHLLVNDLLSTLNHDGNSFLDVQV